jgi:hypothetical protein
VTSPNGRVFTLRPSSGLSELVVQREDGSLSQTMDVRLAARYENAARVDHPAAIDADIPAVAQQLDDAALRGIPDLGVWKFEFIHADASQANSVQYARTLTRAPTLAEMRNMGFAALTAAARTALQADGAATAGLKIFLTVPSATSPAWLELSAPQGGDFWTVPDGVPAPYLVSAFGYGPAQANGTSRIYFNDALAVSSTARKATIKCSAQDAGDGHCDSVRRDSFAKGSYVNALELSSRTSQQLKLSTVLPLWVPR